MKTLRLVLGLLFFQANVSLADFTYATSTGTFPIDTSVPSDWSAFNWVWSDQDHQKVLVRFTGVTGATNVLLRLAYPEKGSYYLTVNNGVFTDDGSGISYITPYAIPPSNIPPNKVYFAEFLMTGAGGVSRTLAKGRIKTDWSVFSLTNAASWAPISVTYPTTGSVQVTESDPVYTASVAQTISAALTGQWSTAHSWGNHATNGYATTNQLNAATNYLNTAILNGSNETHRVETNLTALIASSSSSTALTALSNQYATATNSLWSSIRIETNRSYTIDTNQAAQIATLQADVVDIENAEALWDTVTNYTLRSTFASSTGSLWLAVTSVTATVTANQTGNVARLEALESGTSTWASVTGMTTRVAFNSTNVGFESRITSLEGLIPESTVASLASGYGISISAYTGDVTISLSATASNDVANCQTAYNTTKVLTGQVAVLQSSTSLWSTAAVNASAATGQIVVLQSSTSLWNTAATDASFATGQVALLVGYTNRAATAIQGASITAGSTDGVTTNSNNLVITWNTNKAPGGGVAPDLAGLSNDVITLNGFTNRAATAIQAGDLAGLSNDVITLNGFTNRAATAIQGATIAQGTNSAVTTNAGVLNFVVADNTNPLPFQPFSTELAITGGWTTVYYSNGTLPRLVVWTNVTISIDSTEYPTSGVNRVSLEIFAPSNEVSFDTATISNAIAPTISTGKWNSIFFRRTGSDIWMGRQ